MLCSLSLHSPPAYHYILIIIRSLDLLAVVHHVQGLVSHTLSMNGVSLWKATHYHVSITYCLHLEGGREGGGRGKER